MVVDAGDDERRGRAYEEANGCLLSVGATFFSYRRVSFAIVVPMAVVIAAAAAAASDDGRSNSGNMTLLPDARYAYA